MKRRTIVHTGVLGWAVIALGAIVYDCYIIHKDKESLSGGFWFLRDEHEIAGPAILGTWVGVTCHLCLENLKRSKP